jgi:hypothetical protein
MRTLAVKWAALLGDMCASFWGHECLEDSRRHVWSAGDVWTFQDEEWFSDTPADAPLESNHLQSLGFADLATL